MVGLMPWPGGVATLVLMHSAIAYTVATSSRQKNGEHCIVLGRLVAAHVATPQRRRHFLLRLRARGSRLEVRTQEHVELLKLLAEGVGNKRVWGTAPSPPRKRVASSNSRGCAHAVGGDAVASSEPTCRAFGDGRTSDRCLSAVCQRGPQNPRS